MSRMTSFLFAALVLAAMPATGDAQPAWPRKPITIVVPFPAGGGTDLVVRALQPALSGKLGQTIIINNLGGAGGTIGSAQAARAQPDGYTALAVTASTHAVSPSLYKNLPYGPMQDFSYVGFIGTSPYVLVANPALKARSVAELAQVLKARGQSTFASVGVGTVSHPLGEIFRRDQGVQMTHVPYRGAAPAYTQQLWYGLTFPKGTPADIVTRMNGALDAVLRDPAVAADLASKGVDVRPDTPEALARAVARETPYWGDIARSVGAQLD